MYFYIFVTQMSSAIWGFSIYNQLKSLPARLPACMSNKNVIYMNVVHLGGPRMTQSHPTGYSNIVTTSLGSHVMFSIVNTLDCNLECDLGLPTKVERHQNKII